MRIWDDIICIPIPKIDSPRKFEHLEKIVSTINGLSPNESTVPEFYGSRKEKAVVVKDLLRRHLYNLEFGKSEIARFESLWTGTIPDHSTIIHSIKKDMRPLYNKYPKYYNQAKAKIESI